MRRLLIGFLLLAPALPARADDAKPAKPPAGESFAAVKEEWQSVITKIQAEAKAAYEEAKKKGDAAVKAFKFDKPMPTAEFSSRFLAIAQKDPEEPDAADALKMALQTSFGREGKASENRARAISLLQAHFVTKPQIKGFLGRLTMLDDEGARKLVADVIARNPDRKVQAAAYKGMIANCESQMQFAEMYKDKERAEMIEKSLGKEATQQRLAQADKAKGELEGLKGTLRGKYGDLVNDLSVGKPAPEVVSQDLDGKTVHLSDLKGQVVVLDIWATWCGPCKAMIPHEREMVGRLQGKPFRLVGLSIDDQVKPLKEFLDKEKLPWTHWWAGPGGWESAFAQDWDIRSIPAIFVLDAKGTIRHKNIRGEELEKAVNTLLKEMEPKKTASK